MMKKIVRYSLSLLTVLIVLLLLAPFFLNVDDYKQQIEQRVEDETGRILKIGGLEASLFPWVGITLDNVVLANRMGFSHTDFLKVKHLDVQVALLPLLNKKLEIVRFNLVAPEIFIERNASGEGNWEDLLPSSAQQVTAIEARTNKVSTPTSSAEETPLLAALTAETLQLSDGKFIWQDAQSDVRMMLTDVQITLDDVQLDKPVHAEISARLNHDTIDVEAQVGPLGDLSKLDIQHLPAQISIKSQGIRLQPFKAWIGNFPEQLGELNQASVMLDAQLEQRPDGKLLLAGEGALSAAMRIGLQWKVEMPDAKRLNLNDVKISVNEKPVFVVQGDVKHLQSNPHYSLRIQGESLDRAWLSSILPELNGLYANHPAAWRDLKVGASLAGSSERVDLRDVQVFLDDEVVQLSGSIGFAKAPNIRLRMAAKTLHLDPWLPVVKEVDSGSTETVVIATEKKSEAVKPNPIQQDEAKEPDLRFLADWHVSMQLQVEKLLMRGLEMGHVRGMLKGERGIFKLNPLSFNLAEGQVRETATLNANHYPVSWTESVHVSGLKLKPVLQAVADTDLLDGTMKLETHLKSTGLLPKSSLASLNGTGQLLLQNGRIKGFDIAGALRNLGSLGTQKGSQYTDFAQLQATFNIRDGIAQNDDLFMASPLFRLTGKGLVNLVDSTLDYHVRPKLVGSLVGQGDTLTVRKGLSVPLHISGAFASPMVVPEVDVQSLLENVGGVTGSGASAVGGVLGGVLKGAGAVLPQKQQEKPALSPQKDQQPTVEQQLQKGVKGLLGF